MDNLARIMAFRKTGAEPLIADGREELGSEFLARRHAWLAGRGVLQLLVGLRLGMCSRAAVADLPLPTAGTPFDRAPQRALRG
jgi:hypothetical protein